MDIHDYDRLQSIALTEPNSPWNLQFTLAYQQLHRLGVVRFIDYAEFYPKSTQQAVLRHNTDLVADVPQDAHRRAAIHAAEGRIAYQRGSYQESFREGIGQDLEVFTDGRRTERSRRADLDRGRQDPAAWNERILNQYLAALHVRRHVDDALALDVRGVIGEGEAHILGGGSTGDVHTDRTTSLPAHGAVDGSHVTRLAPDRHLLELPIGGVGATRTLFDTISDIAADVTGVQHDDWLFFAPTIAMPRHHELFDMERIRAELRHELTREALLEETVHVIDTLRTRSEPNAANGKLQYETDWLAEHAGIDAAQPSYDELTALTEYAVCQSQYSRVLRELVERNELSHAAAFVGACVVSDPATRDADQTTIDYRRDQVLIGLASRSVDEDQLMAIRRRKTAWEEQSDWYETSHRIR